ncbi:GNAT family N-acetyltransferase [Paenisporosarcina sp. NPDC076898]|uniref:GNAT family N-acetyltransferase n=1 Tax=unclassified Paenisporosarcina TaxID=2642018 RepID=UPI003D042B82
MINFYGTQTLKTNRLILRKIVEKDAPSFFNNWMSDDRVTDNLIKGAHKSISESVERVTNIVNEYEDQEFCYWGIELTATGDLIGSIDFYNFDDTTENCEVGFSLGYDWWNQGYGTEALKAVLEFGFQHMNIHKISAAHNTDNPASGKIMQKAGMEQEGLIRHMILNAKNQYKDCAVYGILQEDYLVLMKKSIGVNAQCR